MTGFTRQIRKNRLSAVASSAIQARAPAGFLRFFEGLVPQAATTKAPRNSTMIE